MLEIAVRWVPALISNFDKKPARLPALISNVSKKSAGRGRGRRSGSPADVAPMGTRLRVAAAGQTADRARRRSNCRPQVRTELINQSLRWLTDKLGVAGYNARRNCIEIAVIAACPDF